MRQLWAFLPSSPFLACSLLCRADTWRLHFPASLVNWPPAELCRGEKARQEVGRGKREAAVFLPFHFCSSSLSWLIKPPHLKSWPLLTLYPLHHDIIIYVFVYLLYACFHPLEYKLHEGRDYVCFAHGRIPNPRGSTWHRVGTLSKDLLKESTNLAVESNTPEKK